ncbi:hypothetical protein BJ508DRAFT_176170 [Ascobolus immersus RN42]|uniref:Uncharacterized protein n=1 Tax=Ascobolus immersus RN42 TaxID=1160509 RepID=A0A3N4IGZ9_ASCIM|nr:hypothetical protein BJ508DRAFT_176170 [Ascobolus immersus RN42]
MAFSYQYFFTLSFLVSSTYILLTMAMVIMLSGIGGGLGRLSFVRVSGFFLCSVLFLWASFYSLCLTYQLPMQFRRSLRCYYFHTFSSYINHALRS